MTSIRISKAEYDKLRKLQLKTRNDCHAAFSTNLSEIPWPFATYGHTPEQLRKELHNLSPILAQVVGIFIELRQSTSGGRFLIDKDGVYWKGRDKNEHRFIEWLAEEPLVDEPQPISKVELLALMQTSKTK